MILVAHEDNARREREQHHLVRVPGDRARTLDPFHAVRVRRREECRAAVRRVDVEPDASCFAERADRVKIVEAPGRCRARGRDDRHDGLAVMLQPVERFAQREDVHLPIARRDGDGIPHPEPHLANGARHRVMSRLAVDDQRWIRRDALRPHVRQRDRPRREQPGECRLGAAGGECPPAPGAETRQLAEPAHDPVLDHRPGRRHLPHCA